MIITVRPPGGFPTRKAFALGISQTTHCWLAGQLARQWGNSSFSFPGPGTELAAAAELHDLGYADWERHPAWNPETGLPFSFQDLPCVTRLQVWRKAFEEVLSISRYAALFVSKHTTHLCEKHGATSDKEEEALVAEFRTSSVSREKELISALKKDERFAPYLTPEKLALQQDIVAVWDTLSLYVCGALGEHLELDLPKDGGNVEPKLRVAPRDRAVLTVEPWPFRSAEVVLDWEAKVFERPFQSQSDLDTHFGELEIIPLQAALRPSESG